MDLLALVDRLEELVGNAQKMPIGSRAIIDRRRLLDIVDQMRIAIPQEVREAQQMVANRDAHMREAEEEARLIIARAEDKAARLVEQHELTMAARKRAEEVAREAERRLQERIDQANADIEHRIGESRRLAGQQMDAADAYARELLERLDRQLQAFVRSVESGISQLESTAGHHGMPSRQELELEPEPERAPESRTPAERQPGHHPERAPERDPEPEPEERHASPIPMWREEVRSAPVEERQPAPTMSPPEPDGGLENLLRRRPRPVRPGEQAPVVIDDFALPELDDEPSRNDDARHDDDRRR